MDLYDIAVARKLSSGGGGGSSDFSTATLTTENINNLQACFTAELPGIEASFTSYASGREIILYKGKALVKVPESTGDEIITGDIEYISDGIYVVTGDCTINLNIGPAD